MKKLLLFAVSLLLSIAAYAQTEIKGTVTDGNGDPLAGVGVLAVGQNYGVITDIDGKYTIPVNASVRELQFSYIGMIEQTVRISGKKVVNVEMKEDRNFLDEAVVVGYGVQKKAHMTGSVVAVSSHELQKTTVSNVSQALVGKLPGIITQQGVGQPGSDAVSILVRGYSSYNDSGSVLVLVDGVERNMNTVNPADIESISVLKDAASCAVYGMKGANGVILITTKRGSEGTASVNYSGKFILSNPTAYPKMMNGTEYMTYYNIAYGMDGYPSKFFSDEELAAVSNGDPSDGLENTDYTAPFYRTTTMNQHNVSVSGGNSKANYFVSGAYQKQNGFIEGNSNTRYNVRSNVDINATRNLKVSLGIGISDQEYYQPGSASYANATTGGTLPWLLSAALPFIPQEVEIDGIKYATSAIRTRDAFVGNGLVGSQNSGYQKSSNFKMEASGKIEYSFSAVPGLKASVFGSWDWNEIESKSFAKSYYLMAFQFADHAKGLDAYKLAKSSNGYDDGNLYVGFQKSQRLLIRPALSYANKFGKHNVSALFLYEANNMTSYTVGVSKRGFSLLDIQELSFASKIDAPGNITGARGLSRYAGFVGRLNYSYAEKYLLELAGRYDGSYLFERSSRWGFFPSASLGWVVSKEGFFKDAFPSVDMFKIRGSLGEVGNDNVSAYLYRKNYVLSQNATAFGQTPQGALVNQTSYPQSDLTWERVRTADAGWEFSAWKGLFSMEFDWFYKYTYNILCSITSQYAPSLGGHYPTTQNMGEFDNRGFELSLRHQNHVGDFTYSLSGNVSWAHNRIVRRTEAENILPWQTAIGHSVGEVMGYISDGLFQTMEEIESSAIPTGLVPGVSVREGDIKYVDLNGDGTIDSKDMTYIGKSTRPEMMYALQFDASWRGFDMSVQFQGGALCNKMLLGSWSNGVSDATPMTRPWYGNYDNAPLYLVQDSWTPLNTEARYPRLTTTSDSYTNNYRVSDFWMRNGAYVRLKNVSLGYTIPARIVRKAGLSKVRVFVSGNNLLTFTEFKYLDPESPNVVTSYYPQQKNLTFGVDLSF